MIDELIERVEKGEGADRELDAQVAVCVGAVPDDSVRMFLAADPATFATGAYTSVRAGAYTTSLDAVIALIEEKLPGAFGDVDLGALPVDQPLYGARLFSADWDPWKNVSAEAASPARALCAAFLKAHKEQHDG